MAARIPAAEQIAFAGYVVSRSAIRQGIFLVLLSLPLLAWLALKASDYLCGIECASKLVWIVGTVSPLIAKDISLFGEITPAAFAALVIALAPTSPKLKSWDQLSNVVALVFLLSQILRRRRR
jgi:hypothetical protein